MIVVTGGTGNLGGVLSGDDGAALLPGMAAGGTVATLAMPEHTTVTA